MKAMRIDTGILPGDAAANLPATGPEAEKRTTGLLSMLAERFRESTGEQKTQNSLVVLPFVNLGTTQAAPLYGFALADAIAARLARIPSLVVRPSSALMPLAGAQSWAQMDPLAVGQKLLVKFVLAGSFVRSENGFDLNWQLLDVASQSVRTGGSIRVASLDLIAVQSEISNEVFATLQGMGAAEGIESSRTGLSPETNRAPARAESLRGLVSERYLQARALLTTPAPRFARAGDFWIATPRKSRRAAWWKRLAIWQAGL